MVCEGVGDGRRRGGWSIEETSAALAGLVGVEDCYLTTCIARTGTGHPVEVSHWLTWKELYLYNPGEAGQSVSFCTSQSNGFPEDSVASYFPMQ